MMKFLRSLFGGKKKRQDPFETTGAFKRFAQMNALKVSNEMWLKGNFPPPTSYEELLDKYVQETGSSPFVADATLEGAKKLLDIRTSNSFLQ